MTVRSTAGSKPQLTDASDDTVEWANHKLTRHRDILLPRRSGGRLMYPHHANKYYTQAGGFACLVHCGMLCDMFVAS